MKTEALRLDSLRKQKEIGIDLFQWAIFRYMTMCSIHRLCSGLFQRVLPIRVEKLPLETYFAIARGNKDAVASEMTKWFNTNYHYIVPEFEGVKAGVGGKPSTRIL